MDAMYVDPDRGRAAVAAAVDAVAARRSDPGHRPPDIPVPAFGQGLADRGAALAGLLGAVHGERERILSRLDARLGALDRSLRQASDTDRSAADRLSAEMPAQPGGGPR